MRFVKVFFLIAIFFFGLLFFVQNIEVLRNTFTLKLELPGIGGWYPETAIPYYFIVLTAFALGMIFATCFFLLDRISTSYKILRFKLAVRTLEKEVQRLRGAQPALSGKKAVEAKSAAQQSADTEIVTDVQPTNENENKTS